MNTLTETLKKVRITKGKGKLENTQSLRFSRNTEYAELSQHYSMEGGFTSFVKYVHYSILERITR